MAVTGHGDISTKDSIETMKEYFTSIKDAIGAKTKLDSLKKKYEGYQTIPIMTGFNITVRFIPNKKNEAEMKKK
jgi:hypothetical protein